MIDAECPVVQINDGKLKGFVSKATDSNAVLVYNYLNIPFGKPPTGKRRFMPPEKCDGWEGVRDATVNLIHPVQDSEVANRYNDLLPMKHSLGGSYDEQSEDCLQLNVFTPSLEKSEKLAVMFWIVGGAYMRGTAGSYDGVALCGMNNVVVVAPNYRVNALGFLSLGKGTKCPGNNAMLDLILALEWVRDNIHAFGGDPNSVTLFGESAGACLVELLMFSPLSLGLFHKAIALSGSALSSALFSDGVVMRKLFLKILQIDDEDPDVILAKLQALTTEEITKAQKTFLDINTFKPTVDGHVIRDLPPNLAKTGQVAPVPFINGVCDSEGGGLLCFISLPNFFTGCSENDITQIFEALAKQEYPNADSAQVAKLLVDRYSSIADDTDKLKYSKIYGQTLADVIFNVPAVMSVTAHSAIQCPTYLYVMSKRAEFNHSERNGPGLKNKPDYVNCDHGDTCHYIWGVPFVKMELPAGAWFTKEETEFSRITMRYLTNFAKTGNPNEGSKVPVEWPSYDPENKRHIVLDTDVTIGDNFASDAVAFYTQTIVQKMAEMSKN